MDQNPPQPALLSQILDRHPHFHGPIARHVTPARTTDIILTLHAAEPTQRDLQNGFTDPPAARWHLTDTDTGGPLSLPSFLSVHTLRNRTIPGATITTVIEGEDRLARMPFIFRHPSGYLQLIHFSPETRSFYRQILYIVDEIPTEITRDPDADNPAHDTAA